MGNIKHVIREVEPEQTDFSFYFDDDGIKEAGEDFCYSLFIVQRERYGRLYGFQIDEYREIVKELDYLGNDFDNVKTGNGWSNSGSYKEVMRDYGLHYTPRRCHALKELIFSSDFDSADPETVAAYLTIKTGRAWDVVSARGYCQGDYCEVVYCKDFHKEPKACGEIWLGAGKEFCVIDIDEGGNEADSCYGYIVADCQAWKDEDYKRLVCEWACISEAETRLEMIDGSHTYTRYSYRTA